MNIEDIHIQDVLPTIKCTDCGREVDLLLLEEHKCTYRGSLEHEDLVLLKEIRPEEDIFSEKFPTFQFRKSSIYSIDSEDYDEPESHPSSPVAKREEFIEEVKTTLDFLNIYNDLLSKDHKDGNEQVELEVTQVSKSNSHSNREVTEVSSGGKPYLGSNVGWPKSSRAERKFPPLYDLSKEVTRQTKQNLPKNTTELHPKGVFSPSPTEEKKPMTIEYSHQKPELKPSVEMSQSSAKLKSPTAYLKENFDRSLTEVSIPIPIPNGNGNAKDSRNRPEISRPKLQVRGLPPPGSVFTSKAPESLFNEKDSLPLSTLVSSSKKVAEDRTYIPNNNEAFQKPPSASPRLIKSDMQRSMLTSSKSAGPQKSLSVKSIRAVSSKGATGLPRSIQIPPSKLSQVTTIPANVKDSQTSMKRLQTDPLEKVKIFSQPNKSTPHSTKSRLKSPTRPTHKNKPLTLKKPGKPFGNSHLHNGGSVLDPLPTKKTIIGGGGGTREVTPNQPAIKPVIPYPSVVRKGEELIMKKNIQRFAYDHEKQAASNTIQKTIITREIQSKSGMASPQSSPKPTGITLSTTPIIIRGGDGIGNGNNDGGATSVIKTNHQRLNDKSPIPKSREQQQEREEAVVPQQIEQPKIRIPTRSKHGPKSPLKPDLCQFEALEQATRVCEICTKDVVDNERSMEFEGKSFHQVCFNCLVCSRPLDLASARFEGNKLYCEQDYRTSGVPICPGCNSSVLGECFSALDSLWHPGHLLCTHCKIPVKPESGFVEYQRRVYCSMDYALLILPKCHSCTKPIGKKTVRALGAKWHPQCFRCQTCRKPFPDRKFFIHQNTPYCRQHYHEVNHSLCT